MNWMELNKRGNCFWSPINKSNLPSFKIAWTVRLFTREWIYPKMEMIFLPHLRQKDYLLRELYTLNLLSMTDAKEIPKLAQWGQCNSGLKSNSPVDRRVSFRAHKLPRADGKSHVSHNWCSYRARHTKLSVVSSLAYQRGRINTHWFKMKSTREKSIVGSISFWHQGRHINIKSLRQWQYEHDNRTEKKTKQIRPYKYSSTHNGSAMASLFIHDVRSGRNI